MASASKFSLISFAAFVLGILCSASLTAQPTPVKLDPKEADLLKPTSAPIAPVTTEKAAAPVEKENVERFKVLRSSMRPEKRSEEELKLRALEGFLDYDDEEGIIYNPQRTQIVYGKYFMEADRVIIDNRLQEVQAEGNVIFKTTETTKLDQEIHASSFRYNFGENEGVAFDVKGQFGPVYFKTDAPKNPQEAKTPPFQQVSRDESLFRHTSVTTCDFKVPHYRIRATEVILFSKDRIFFRGATFYVMDVPVMYLPFFTKGIEGGTPWYVIAGTGSRTGARLRIGYEYDHETKEPKLGEDNKYETRSSGHANAFMDVMAKHGLGAGFNYKYSFDFGRHKGEFESYAMDDIDRTVGSNTLQTTSKIKDEPDRWQILWKNRSQITPHLSATINVDMFSDPEIFYDVLDRFAEDDLFRNRVPERRARAALTYLREAYVARLLVETKDRIGIDRFGNYSIPADNNQDFDIEPGVKLKKADANSIAHSRWGRVSEKLPELTFATRYLPLGSWPVYLLSDIRAYNNLDKGFNTVSTKDDAFVRGLDVYHQLLWQYRITERYVLLAKIGAGVGIADRDSDKLGIKVSDLTANDSIDLINDKGDFIVGTKKLNLDQINPGYAYGDASLRFNARFSDALSGYLEWRYRKTTNDFIGDFYAKAGDYTSREDLFDYRLREHWLNGNLTYSLLNPAISVFANGGVNLEGHSDLFPNEVTDFWNVGARWENQRKTLMLTGSVGQSDLQVLAPSDPGEGTQTYTFYRATLQYNPIHGRWYTRLTADRTTSAGSSTEPNNSKDFTFFTDTTSRTRLTWLYGRELGPKWNTEIRAQWDDRVQGLKEVSWLLQRDMHDAIATMRIRERQSVTNATSATNLQSEHDISFGLKLKLPEKAVSFGQSDIKTIRQRERAPVVAY